MSRYYEDRYEYRRAEAERDLMNSGFVRDEYGHYENPDKPWMTGRTIDEFGNVRTDM